MSARITARDAQTLAENLTPALEALGIIQPGDRLKVEGGGMWPYALTLIPADPQEPANFHPGFSPQNLGQTAREAHQTLTGMHAALFAAARATRPDELRAAFERKGD